MTPPRRTILALALLVAGCHADPNTGGDKKQSDAGSDMLAAPTVSAPSATPLDTVALRGIAPGATRVVVKADGSNTSQVSPLLPGGGYCVDADLPPAATTGYQIYAVAEGGAISQPATVSVTQDDSAMVPPMSNCSGDTSTCADTETCDNGVDDDCDGLVDQCDTDCNGCQDDYLEPNDTPFEVPIMTPGAYRELQICPCRDDWYSLPVGPGGRIHVIITYNQSAIDVDCKLFTADNAEQNGPAEATSAGTSGTEDIDYTSTNGGTYYLKVYGFSNGTPNLSQGSYDMTVE